ncbi:BrnT family toxin [Leptospira sp. 96542]|nr:BrnT family toxin [Leptospira sp. 96542]
MRFEWDTDKELSNLNKHQISFTKAAFVFADPKTIFLPDPDHSDGEIREIALGKIENITIAVVIFVDRSNKEEEVIRIISARRATLKEEAQYYSNEIT